MAGNPRARRVAPKWRSHYIAFILGALRPQLKQRPGAGKSSRREPAGNEQGSSRQGGQRVNSSRPASAATGARDGLLRTVWQGDADALHCLSQTRHAFGLAIASLSAASNAGPIVWFPDYFCENALCVVRQSGARIAFYPITGDLAPDWQACRELATHQPPALFVLVHYFGLCGEAQAARDFCDRTGAVLLEDATHVMRPGGQVGRFADLACYSPHKFFPVPDGGLLVVRGRDLAQRVEAAAHAASSRAASAAAWVAHRFMRRIKHSVVPPRSRLPTRTRSLDADPARTSPMAGMWMSRYSRWRLRHSIRSGEAEKLAGARLQAHRCLSSSLAAHRPLQAIGSTGALVPYWTVMRCADAQSAAAILNELRAVGARVNTWPGLPPEVKDDPVRHRAALHLRRTLLRFTLDPESNRAPTDFLAALPPALRAG